MSNTFKDKNIGMAFVHFTAKCEMYDPPYDIILTEGMKDDIKTTIWLVRAGSLCNDCDPFYEKKSKKHIDKLYQPVPDGYDLELWTAQMFGETE